MFALQNYIIIIIIRYRVFRWKIINNTLRAKKKQVNERTNERTIDQLDLVFEYFYGILLNSVE